MMKETISHDEEPISEAVNFLQLTSTFNAIKRLMATTTCNLIVVKQHSNQIKFNIKNQSKINVVKFVKKKNRYFGLIG